MKRWLPALIMIVMAGCPTLDTAREQCGAPSDLDFDGLHARAMLALDLTEVNAGRMPESEFRARHEFEGATVELIAFDPTETRYALLHEPAANRMTLVLAGTTNVAGNAFNLRDSLAWDEVAAGRMHDGYRELALALRSEINPRLVPDSVLTIVGFSQGGALAVLLPLWLNLDRVRLEQVLTLGQPKVVERSLAGRMALLPVTRLIAADDGVPGLPKASEYAHFGRSVVLLDGPRVVSLNPGEPGYEDPLELPAELPDFLTLDHATYRLRLESKLRETVVEIPLPAATDASATSATIRACE